MRVDRKMEYTPGEKKEQRAVLYLKSQMDQNNPKEMAGIYNQIIEQKIFHTDTGISFLAGLRQRILEDGSISEDMLLPMEDAAGKTGGEQESRKEQEPRKEQESPEEHKPREEQRSRKQRKFLKEKNIRNKSGRQEGSVLKGRPDRIGFEQPLGNMSGKFALSVFLNVVLLVMVAIMFVMTVTSDSPNIINYRNQLEDEYAAWDEELTRRELEVKKKEAQLRERENNAMQQENGSETGQDAAGMRQDDSETAPQDNLL